MHPLYPALRYVLLFPTGQLGWFHGIPHIVDEDDDDNEVRFVTMAEFYRYHLAICPLEVESNHLFLCGNLFQEFVCESWAITEQNRLNFVRHNQRALCADLYQGLVDTVVADVDADQNQLGKRLILPSSFAGSTRNMQQHCQDALAINRYFGGGDIFVTITANPAWPEIQQALLEGQTSSDRPVSPPVRGALVLRSCVT